MNIVSLLYKLARSANSLRALNWLFTGRPQKFVKHQVNRWIGRSIGRRMYWK